MLLTVATTMANATDLGYLLHKHPGRVHTFSLNFGHAHVFYPEATDKRCVAAMLVEIDPVALVRSSREDGANFALYPYVNDRPYVASSFTSVALGRAFSSAMKGRCKDKPELENAKIPLEATVSVVPCRGGETFLRELFEPLGYEVTADPFPLDETHPEWGRSPFFRVHLKGTTRLQDLLTHLYVLLPVLDTGKHYWVGDDEVAKLLRAGEGWLKDHPKREQIAIRYLKNRKSLARAAIEQLLEETPDADTENETPERPAARLEVALEAPLRLNDVRLVAVVAAVDRLGPSSVVDLGCGEGKLLQRLLKLPGPTRIAGMDVSVRSLEVAADRLRLDRMPDKQRQRLELFHGSLLYRDRRLEGFDLATLIEVVEHLELDRVAALERVLFKAARPRHVIVTTPNREYNAKFPDLPAGKFRHGDHRFEWTRAEFRGWADRVAAAHGYTVSYSPVGEEDPTLGPPTQMAVFSHGN